MMLLPAAVIRKKRDGQDLSEQEIDFFVSGYHKGTIPDYQMSALLMAIVLKGMTPAETAVLTRCMLHSGKTLTFKATDSLPVDKHSTGGIGDKTSLIIAPLVAACGVRVPMIAGRGLGHTGGTIDKLESIKDFKTQLTLEQFQAQVEKLKGAIIGQTEDICPADKKIYALRDVTGTVESLPLICGSILSKKIAEGIKGLVLDVKCGSGAFMKNISQARELARWLVKTGEDNGVKTRAYITNMEEPLGRFIGNGIEVLECMSLMTGQSYYGYGPQDFSDTRELTLQLSAEMLVLSGLWKDHQAAYEQAECTLESGGAYQKWCEIVKSQGGDPEKIIQPPVDGWHHICASSDGFLANYDTEAIGYAAIALGAGRKVTGEQLDLAASIIVHKKVGDRINKNEKLFSVFGSDSQKVFQAEAFLTTAYKISLQKPAMTSLILDKL